MRSALKARRMCHLLSPPSDNSCDGFPARAEPPLFSFFSWAWAWAWACVMGMWQRACGNGYVATGAATSSHSASTQLYGRWLIQSAVTQLADSSRQQSPAGVTPEMARASPSVRGRSALSFSTCRWKQQAVGSRQQVAGSR